MHSGPERVTPWIKNTSRSGSPELSSTFGALEKVLLIPKGSVQVETILGTGSQWQSTKLVICPRPG